MTKDNMAKLDIAILGRLIQNKKNMFNESIQLNELNELLSNVNKKTLYNHLRSLVKKGLVNEGVKDGRYKTYYISQLGINELNKMNIIK